MAKPIIVNRPILTGVVKVTEVKTMGPDLKIDVQGDNGPKCNVGLKKSWFFHKPVSNSMAKLEVKYRIVDDDPVYVDDSGEKEFPLPIQLKMVAEEKAKEISPTPVKHTAYEGPKWGHRIGIFDVKFHYSLNTNIMDVIHYIHGEMYENKGSAHVALIKSFREIGELKDDFLPPWAKKLLAYKVSFGDAIKAIPFIYFASLVKEGAVWDHKTELTLNPKEIGPYTLDSERGVSYFNDIWSNIHFGYIGRVAGFSKGELLKGAALAQAKSDTVNFFLEQEKLDEVKKLIDAIKDKKILKVLEIYKGLEENFIDKLEDVWNKFLKDGIEGLDHPQDRGAILLGSELFDKYGNAIPLNDSSKIFILKKVRNRQRVFDTKKFWAGKPPKKFLKVNNQF